MLDRLLGFPIDRFLPHPLFTGALCGDYCSSLPVLGEGMNRSNMPHEVKKIGP
jgi:hypothetical protein